MSVFAQAKLPLLQAPIGSAANPDLVVAVSNAGAIGSLGASWTPLDKLRSQVETIRAHTDLPFAVNLVLDFDQTERVALLAELRVPIVTLSWGIRSDFIGTLRAAGCSVWQQIGSVAEVAAARAANVDALIVQGVEAGGHVQGQLGLLPFIRAVRAAWIGAIIFAAGGLGDGPSIAGALEAGADGVVCGTAFVVARESLAHDVWKDAIVHASVDDTFHGMVFDKGWPTAPQRVLVNSTVRTWLEAGALAPGQGRPGEDDIVAYAGTHPLVRYGDDVALRTTAGDVEALALYAGQSAGLVNAIEPAADIVGRFASWIEPYTHPRL